MPEAHSIRRRAALELTHPFLQLKYQKRFDAVACRRTGKHCSGRLKKVSSELMNQMFDPQQNSMRDQPWPVQIEHFQLDVAPRIL